MVGLIFAAGTFFMAILVIIIAWFSEHICVVGVKFYQKNGKCLQLLPCIEVYHGYEKGSDTPNMVLIGWLYWSVEFRYNE